MKRVDLHHGDCLDVLRTLPDNSVDSVVTDPPYGLAFMGKKWDYDVPSEDIWRECLRVLKPGGHLLAFAGTRTQHRMAVRIEDAGFEIRDMIAWVYGSGMPKSLDISKALDKKAGAEREVIGVRVYADGTAGHYAPVSDGWDRPSSRAKVEAKQPKLDTAPATPEAQQWAGWGTALKPSLEPITVARKPLTGTVAANVQQWGAGGLNIDGCRVESGADYHDLTVTQGGRRQLSFGMAERKFMPASGRWPANLIHDGSDEVLALFPGSDSGSAARFFYCSKASRRDRNEGVGGSDAPAVREGATMRDREDADWQARNGNHHNTVKPTDLMRHLCRLVTPPGGVVLDPFMGSGSTGKAAILEGFGFVGIDLSEEYVQIARQRVAHAQATVRARQPVLLGGD
ncbi:site-specific DNA-methyltransferase [Deinococcus actinosclerus]|nr:site-specific DNA-methyltransferase [Deinococcus actinosclerus]